MPEKTSFNDDPSGHCGTRVPGSTARTEATPLARWIDDAAREVVRRLTVLNGGECPANQDDFRRCCERLSIAVEGLTSSSGFAAVLIGTPDGAWTIFYNAAANSEKQCRYLAHELTEYITREQSWHQAPPEPGMHIDEYSVRHDVARRVESLCFADPLRTP